MLAPEEEHSLQRRRNLANIYPSDQRAKSTTRDEYFPQGHQKCKYIFEQGRKLQTGRHECVEGGQEGVAVDADGHAVLGVTRGVARPALGQQERHLEFRVCAVRDVCFETSLSGRGYAGVVQESVEGPVA